MESSRLFIRLPLGVVDLSLARSRLQFQYSQTDYLCHSDGGLQKSSRYSNVVPIVM